MFAEEIVEPASSPQKQPTAGGQPMPDEFDPSVLVRKDQKPSNPFAQFP